VFESKSPFLTVPRWLAVPGLVHGFGDGRWSEEDFAAFAAAKGMTPVVMRQVHGDAVVRLDGPPAAKPEGDALMTDVPGLLLVIRTADCLPVLLLDAERRAVAAVHCGWRGTAKRILEKAVRAMGEAYGSKPADLTAALGPCIGAACYEVGAEVREAYLEAGFPPSLFAVRGHAPEAPPRLLEPKYILDLRGANAWLLERLGFDRARIVPAGPACAHCEPRLLSYRRNPADPRRMVNFIGLGPFAF
jgi:YfiH family protein